MGVQTRGHVFCGNIQGLEAQIEIQILQESPGSLCAEKERNAGLSGVQTPVAKCWQSPRDQIPCPCLAFVSPFHQKGGKGNMTLCLMAIVGCSGRKEDLKRKHWSNLLHRLVLEVSQGRRVWEVCISQHLIYKEELEKLMELWVEWIAEKRK